MKKNTILSSIILVTFLISIIAVSPVNAATVGLVAEWNFDEGIGSIASDSTVNANDGVLSGGKFGNALYFDGVDDYVEIPNSITMDVSASYTFEAWIYLESSGTSGVWVYRGFFRRGSYGTTASEIEIYTQPYVSGYNGKLTVVHNRAGSFGYRYFTPFPLDTWVHLAVTWDGTTAKAYYNGEEQISTGTSVVDSAVSDKPSYIGHGYKTAFMKGKIDEVRISNIARTSFNLISAPEVDINTVALWHLDESVGTIAYDDEDTGNSNNGIISGASWAGPTWDTGLLGTTALRFDGVDDYVLVSGSPSLAGITSQITVDAWVNFEDVRNAFYVRTPYDSGLAWGLDRWGGLLRFHIYDGSVYKICSMAWTPTINTWYHIAGTYDGTTLKLYLDGVLSETFGYAGDIDPTGKGVVMGARYSYGGADFHKGLIDEVHIWDVAISDFTLAFEPTSPSIVPKDAFTELTVCLKDNFDKIVPGVPVTFTIDNVPAESVLTGADGTAKISVPTDIVGVYAIKATAETFLGDRDAENYVVVYDPSAGFVTGGGWIYSPAEAYVDDPTLEGKATFGFVSKYKKGADIPTGNTEFVFHAANFKFKSTSYQWLVINGGDKAKFKGEGEVNGVGGYGFMLSATDGGKDGDDTFRIKIWDSSTEAIVYDNNGETALGGGSIIVHNK